MKKAVVTTAVALVNLALPQSAAVHADDIRESQWHLAFLNTTEAHQQSQGDGVIVALVDTGVDANHPDLRENVLAGTDIVPGGSGDGRADADGHGTAMAGLIAGHGHNSTSGVLGIAPRSKILPIRTSTRQEAGDTTSITRALEWAIDQNVDVICIAGGGGTSVELLRAVNAADEKDIILVASAGNLPRDTDVLSPARFEGVVAVAASDRQGLRWPRSITGEQIALAAPGVDIASSNRAGGYAVGTGTSSSAAIIAGAAALVRAKYPDLTADQVIHRLTATADDKGPPGRDEQYGYGVLNLVAALTADLGTPSASPTVGAAPPPAPGRPSTGTVVVLAVAVATILAVAATVIARRRRHVAR